MSTVEKSLIEYDKKGLEDGKLLELYDSLLLPRMIEEKMLSQLRLGKISKWFSSMGQEAISVGVASALESDEYILPMHRNLGIFTTRGIPLEKALLSVSG